MVEIDLDRGSLLIQHRESGGRRWEGFDDLMVGTGAVPLRPPLPGADAAGIFGVQTLDDGVAVRAYVTGHKPSRAVIVGSGYVGLEMAEAFCALGLETHLVDGAEQPLPGLDPDMGELVADALRDFGTVLHLARKCPASRPAPTTG